MPTVRFTFRIGKPNLHRLPPLQRLLAAPDQLVVERLVEPVILRPHAPLRHRWRHHRLVEDLRQIESGRLPVIDRFRHIDLVDASDHLVHRAEPELGHDLAHVLGDEPEEVLDELRSPREQLAQLGILRRDADRARIEMADAHHHASQHHERRRRKAELLGAEQRADHDVAAGLHLAVDLHDDAIAQVVEHEHLLRLGQAELPRHAGMLQARQRRRARAAVVAGDEHDIRVRLGDAGGDGADADLSDELHVNTRARICVLQVVDQLRQVFDRVDVVVRRRRNQADARCRVAHLRNPRIHLVAGELAAFTGLRALRHLDLQVVRVDQIFAGDAEARRRHLLDGAAARIAVRIGHVARRILAAFAGVRLAAEAVHRNRERLVRFLADRAVRHRTGRKALEDLLCRLHLVERNRRGRQLQLEQTAQRRAAARLLVHRAGVLLVDRVLPRASGVLQLEHRVGVEEVILPVTPPLILAALVEIALGDRPRSETPARGARGPLRQSRRCRRRRCATRYA